MPITTIAEIGHHDGESVTIRGWLYNLRESGKLLFPQFRDGTGVIQGVVPKNAVPPEVFDAIKGLTQESSVIVEGKVRADKRAPGGYELDVSNIQVVQRVPKTILSHHAQRARHRFSDGAPPSLGVLARQASILRVRAEIIKAVRDFFDEQRIHSHRSAHPHSRRLRRHQHTVSRWTISTSRLTSPSPASSTLKLPPWRWARSILSGRLSARKNPKPGAT